MELSITPQESQFRYFVQVTLMAGKTEVVLLSMLLKRVFGHVRKLKGVDLIRPICFI